MWVAIAVIIEEPVSWTCTAVVLVQVRLQSRALYCFQLYIYLIYWIVDTYHPRNNNNGF